MPMAHDPKTIVLRFIERINAGDVEGIYVLLTEDHTFIDSLGHTLSGCEAMRSAWESYFRMMPDYSIKVQDIVQGEDLVAVFGGATGTYVADGTLRPENRWSTPAAWKAIVREGRLAYWQVYADNKPVYDIIERSPDP